jgi:hypothetical protein
MSKPKGSKLRAIVPVWARHLAVEERADVLLIKGWGRDSTPIDARLIEPKHRASVDLLHRFRRYVLSHLGKRSPTKDVGVYQFADANSDQKLIEFCQAFGPVWGEVRSHDYQDDGTVMLTVIQSMERLREDQIKFAAAVKLLKQLREGDNADRTVMSEAIRKVTAVNSPVLITLECVEVGLPQFQAPPGAGKNAAYFEIANIVLCEVLNNFPPKIFPINGKTIELPVTEDEGILPAIYWKLRQDYFAGREIGACLNCGSHFTVYKRGTRGCSEFCRRALRNAKHWSENKDSINRSRREKRVEKE